MQQHSKNALFLATKISGLGISIQYPGLVQHAQYALLESLKNEKMGSGGMMVLNMGTKEKAYQLMEKMQNANIGYLAVSLGYYKTLFSSPGSSTSSEIPEEERVLMGLSDGLVRISVGLDASIEDTYTKMESCLLEVIQPVQA
jgi:methionine-gamma-lyase